MPPFVHRAPPVGSSLPVPITEISRFKDAARHSARSKRPPTDGGTCDEWEQVAYRV